MRSMISRFLRNEDGNIAIMSAAAMVPLMMLVIGAVNVGHQSDVRQKMQRAADAAVMSALQVDRMRWNERQKRANRFFRVNMNGVAGVHKLRGSLRRKISKDRLLFSYSARAEIDTLFGSSGSENGKQVFVTATAEISRKTGGRPRLVKTEKMQSRHRP